MLTRLIAIALVMGAAFTGAASAQQPATTNVPHLVCDEPEFDFGLVDQTSNVEHTFILKNTGTLTLEITRAQPSCGCTVADITQKEIPPGGESRISTRFSTAGRTGPQHKTIVVMSNDPEQPQYTLTLKGEIGVALSAKPAQIIMPRVAPGDQPESEVIVESGDGTHFQVTSVSSTSDELAASVSPIEEGRSYRIKVALKHPLEGAMNATLVVNTDHPKRPTLSIPVHFMVSRDMIVAPREITFEQPNDTAVSRFVLLRNADGAPVELDGVEPPGPGVEIAVQPFGSNGVRIQMTGLVPNNEMNGRVLRIRPRGGSVINVPIVVKNAGS